MAWGWTMSIVVPASEAALPSHYLRQASSQPSLDVSAYLEYNLHLTLVVPLTGNLNFHTTTHRVEHAWVLLAE